MSNPYRDDSNTDVSMDTQVSDDTFEYFNRKQQSTNRKKAGVFVPHLSEMSKFTDYSLDHFNNDGDQKNVLYKI
jgi:hypothetical protein